MRFFTPLACLMVLVLASCEKRRPTPEAAAPAVSPEPVLTPAAAEPTAQQLQPPAARKEAPPWIGVAVPPTEVPPWFAPITIPETAPEPRLKPDTVKPPAGSGPEIETGELPTVPPSVDPLDTMPNVEHRSELKRYAELLAPYGKKDGPLGNAETYARELSSRGVALMQLSRHKLEFSDPKGERELIAFIERMKSFKPTGSAVRSGNQPDALKLARKFLEEEQQRGDSINRKARLALAGMKEFIHQGGPEQVLVPDISGKLVGGELTAADLLPFLFHLSECCRNIEQAREADRKLYEFIQSFPSSKDRFQLIEASRFLCSFRLDTKFIQKDQELAALHERESRKGYLSDEFQAVVQKRVYPVFTEQARQYQREMAEWFSARDKSAIASLLAAEALQNEFHSSILRAIPSFKYKLKPVVPKGPDGKPLIEPLRPLTFDFDFADYLTFETCAPTERRRDVSYSERVKPLR